ncbi:hypothetical protein [Candidatus Palauibacter sp.]|uniref:hypothetical protein n=1 Tax=Candidatus Palauibacter sp. TaxID=3101350 RepID=UPI003B01EC20
MLEFRVVDHAGDPNGEVRVVLAQDGETAGVARESLQHRFDQPARRAIPLHDDRQTFL